jgi:hypothetical protein
MFVNKWLVIINIKQIYREWKTERGTERKEKATYRKRDGEMKRCIDKQTNGGRERERKRNREIQKGIVMY